MGKTPRVPAIGNPRRAVRPRGQARTRRVHLLRVVQARLPPVAQAPHRQALPIRVRLRRALLRPAVHLRRARAVQVLRPAARRRARHLWDRAVRGPLPLELPRIQAQVLLHVRRARSMAVAEPWSKKVGMETGIFQKQLRITRPIVGILRRLMARRC